MKIIKFLLILSALALLISCEDKLILENDTRDIIYVTSLPFENSSVKIEHVTDNLPSGYNRIPCGGLTYGDLYFINESTGISVLNYWEDFKQVYKVFRTTDGGLSWQEKFSFPGRILDFSFDALTPGTGFIVGGGHNNDGFLAKTTDGGENWTFMYEDGTFPFQNITIVNGKILLSGTRQNVSGDTDISKIVRSNDGGITWTTAFEESGDIEDRIALSGFVLGSDHSYFIKFYDSRFSVSTDYGATWSEKFGFQVESGSSFYSDHLLAAGGHYFSYGDSHMVGYNTKNSVVFKGTNGIDEVLFSSDSSYYYVLPGLVVGHRYSLVDNNNDGGRINSSCGDGYSYSALIAYEDVKSGTWKEIHLGDARGYNAKGYDWDNARQRYRYYYLVDSYGGLFKLTMK